MGRNASEVIHCIGDSHVMFFTEPCFRKYRLGSALAYNLNAWDTTTRGRLKLKRALRYIPRGAKVMLLLGEIDCRCHLVKQAELQKRPLREVVRDCVDRYFSVTLELKASGYEMLVWHILPQAVEEVGKGDFGTTYGFYCQRREATELFNERLSELAEEHGLQVVSIYDKLMTKEKIRKDEYFSDRVHLSQKAMPLVLEELCRLKLLKA